MFKKTEEMTLEELKVWVEKLPPAKKRPKEAQAEGARDVSEQVASGKATQGPLSRGDSERAPAEGATEAEAVVALSDS